MPARLRLLLVAPYLDRSEVGEALLQYQWAQGLARRHETTVLTVRCEGADFGELPELATVVAFDEPWTHRVVERAPPAVRTLLGSRAKVSHGRFLRHCVRWMDESSERFDVVHQVGPGAARFAAPFARARLAPGTRTVIGPVGGCLPTPEAMRAEVPGSRLRDWFVRPDRLFNGAVRRTYERADLVIGVAPYVKDVLAPFRVRRFEILPDMGFDEAPPARAAHPGDGPVRLIHVGRLVRTKGLEDAIAALATLRSLPWRLTVIGEGPRDGACRALASELGLADRVDFLGRRPREETLEAIRGHDVLVFPSFREPAGIVVMEALSSGVPVVTTAIGGPGFLVDDTCGIRVEVREIGQFRQDLAAAVRRLVEDPALRAELGRRGVARATDLGWWPRKLDWMGERYAEVLGAPPDGAMSAPDGAAPRSAARG